MVPSSSVEVTVCSPLGETSIDQLPSGASILEAPSVISVTNDPSSAWTFLPPYPVASLNSSVPSGRTMCSEPSPFCVISSPSSPKNA